MRSKQPTIDDIYMADMYVTTPGVRQGLLERAAEGVDDDLVTEDTDDGQAVYYRTSYGEMMPLGRPVMLAQAGRQTMSDAGSGMPTIKPIEQTAFERALQRTGLTLEQAGRFLDGLGQVQIPGTDIKLSLADLVPFVGTAKEGTRSVLGPAEWQGTPMALQQAGTGQSLTRGTGFARQLTPDASLALMDVGLNAVPVGRAIVSGGRALAPKAGEMLGGYMQRTGLQPSLMAFHGTPHSFDKFDARKIGSGEGAQAYGYGLYFAETPGVAEEYRTTLAGNKLIFADDAARKNATKSMPFGFADPIAVIKSALGLNNNVASAIRTLRGSYDKDPDLKAHANHLANLLESGAVRSERGGHFYTVDVPDALVAKMLDFDAPINSQSKEIQVLARQYNLQSDDLGGDLLTAADGKTAAGAQRLREAGIPGVRYLDQGSRGQREGTRNIVVFPGGEDQVKILKKEGKQ